MFTLPDNGIKNCMISGTETPQTVWPRKNTHRNTFKEYTPGLVQYNASCLLERSHTRGDWDCILYDHCTYSRRGCHLKALLGTGVSEVMNSHWVSQMGTARVGLDRRVWLIDTVTPYHAVWVGC